MSVRALIRIKDIICCSEAYKTTEIKLDDILREINYFEDWYIKKYNKNVLFNQLKAREV